LLLITIDWSYGGVSSSARVTNPEHPSATPLGRVSVSSGTFSPAVLSPLPVLTAGGSQSSAHQASYGVFPSECLTSQIGVSEYEAIPENYFYGDFGQLPRLNPELVQPTPTGTKEANEGVPSEVYETADDIMNRFLDPGL
jgi:hypothetical protein